jgi:hypothetical protein
VQILTKISLCRRMGWTDGFTEWELAAMERRVGATLEPVQIAARRAMSRRRKRRNRIEDVTSGRSGGASGSVTLGKGKLREENFGNTS